MNRDEIGVLGSTADRERMELVDGNTRKIDSYVISWFETKQTGEIATTTQNGLIT
jgi:hypothetical protein